MFSETVITDKIPVLLVEDSRNEAHVTQRLLHDIDNEFDISRVARLEDALAELTLHKMDAVILDLGLPDSDGPQSIQKINTHLPNLPIIVLSGRNDPDTVRRALEFGAQEFIAKGECTGNTIRQALLGAIIRKSLKN